MRIWITVLVLVGVLAGGIILELVKSGFGKKWKKLKIGYRYSIIACLLLISFFGVFFTVQVPEAVPSSVPQNTNPAEINIPTPTTSEPTEVTTTSPVSKPELTKQAYINDEDTEVFDDCLYISVQGISFEGDPLIHKANLHLSLKGGETKTITKALPGDVFKMEFSNGKYYEIRIMSIDTWFVKFEIFGPIG